jgi:hypothetical protein
MEYLNHMRGFINENKNGQREEVCWPIPSPAKLSWGEETLSCQNKKNQLGTK